MNAPRFASVLLAASLLPAQGPDDAAVRREYKPAQRLQETQESATSPTRAGTLQPSLRTPIHTAEADLGRAYGIWAAGDSYKVSFHAGMTFVPYLGAGYPTTQTWHWRTTSAQLGAVDLLEHTTPTPAQASAWRYEYRFGPLTEAYDVLGGGLEQTFVLHQKPAAGDLVIRGAVSSLLRSKNVGPAQQALVFADDANHDILVYGQATAFDARGERIAVTTGHADGVITLTVPGAWLEQAMLPITVDPLLARVTVATWGAAFGDVESVDVGRDDEAVSSNVMVTYARSVSAGDSDLWARLGNDDFSGASANLVFTDITTSWSTDQTSCAFVGGANRWTVVFRRFFPGATPLSQVRCHVHNSGDTTLLTNYGVLIPPGSNNDWRADVGGVDGFAIGNNALVVFQRENNSGTGGGFANVALSEIYGALLDATTADGTFGTPFPIKPSGIHDNERPSVNQVAEGGTSFSWVCVYQRFVDGTADEDWDLNGARIDQAGTVASGTWISDLAVVAPSQHQLGPVVEGAAGRYAVVFTTVDVPSVNFKTLLIAGKQVQMERFDWLNAAPGPSNDRPPVELRSNSDRRWEAAGLGYDTNDDSHWACSFRAIAPGVPSTYYTRVGYRGEATEGPIGTTLYFVSGENPIGAACVFDNDNNNFLYAYGVNATGPLFPVYGHVLTYVAPAPPSTFGISCSSANLGWSGNQQIGAEFNGPFVTGAPASAIHIMLLATTTVDVPVINPVVFPGCRLFVAAAGPGYLGQFPLAIGSSASFSLPLPEFVVGQTLHMQDWYLDATNLLYSTERLTVQIVK